MYDALMDSNTGVIHKLQSVAYFGMVLYNSGDDPARCPNLLTVEPALDNYNKISSVYNARNAGPGSYTPTALALEQAYKLVPSQNELDKEGSAAFVILCTDGEPNGCGGWVGGMPPTDYEGPVAQVTAAAKKDIETYVVGIAVDGQAQAHLDQLAKLGETGSPAFSPASKDELVAAISQIVGGAVGCQIRLNGKVVVGQECSGYVELNSEKLVCNGANGWKLVDESHILLQGSACKTLMNNSKAIVNAGFPCEVFTQGPIY